MSEEFFDAIRRQIDVDYIQNHVRLLVLGGGRVGRAFTFLAIHHGVRWIRVIEPDTVNRRNFASGFPEAAVGMPKIEEIREELYRQSSRISFEGMQLNLNPQSLETSILKEWFSICTHVGLFIDDFQISSTLAQSLYPHRYCIYAAVLEEGRTGESAFSIPGQTPCLQCSARLSAKRGAQGGQTLLVNVLSTVNIAFRQFMGLCLIDRRGFDWFRLYVQPRFCLATIINGPGGFVEMAPGRPDIPSGVRLVEVVDQNGRSPSCSVCRGYKP